MCNEGGGQVSKSYYLTYKFFSVMRGPAGRSDRTGDPKAKVNEG